MQHMDASIVMPAVWVLGSFVCLLWIWVRGERGPTASHPLVERLFWSVLVVVVPVLGPFFFLVLYSPPAKRWNAEDYPGEIWA